MSRRPQKTATRRARAHPLAGPPSRRAAARPRPEGRYAGALPQWAGWTIGSAVGLIMGVPGALLALTTWLTLQIVLQKLGWTHAYAMDERDLGFGIAVSLIWIPALAAFYVFHRLLAGWSGIVRRRRYLLIMSVVALLPTVALAFAL